MWKTLQTYVLYLFSIDYIHILLLCIEVISNLKICKCQSNYLLGWFDRLLVYSKAYLTVETLHLPSHELHVYLHVFRLMSIQATWQSSCCNLQTFHFLWQPFWCFQTNIRQSNSQWIGNLLSLPIVTTMTYIIL